jgi:probable HAF family extracellular repeat protein
MIAPRLLMPAVAAALAASACPTQSAHAQSITNLGVLAGAGSSAANGVSGDGSVVVGTSSNWAFRWTRTGGMQRIPTFGDAVGWGVSADGSTAVGAGETPNYTWRGFRWSGAAAVDTFGNFGSSTIARATSADGGVTVGQYLAGGGAWRGFRFTSGGGFQDLGHTPSFNSSAAFGVSGDGSVIVGGYTDNDNINQAYRLSGGVWQGLGRLAGGSSSTAYGVSFDGSVVVGASDSASGQQAFRWTAATGMQSLGLIPNTANGGATAVSGDGSIVVGYSDNYAFVWQNSVGMLSLQDYLVSRGVDLTGWSALTNATGISADGRYVVGNGIFEGANRGFIADIGVIPAPGTVALLGLAGLVGRRRR